MPNENGGCKCKDCPPPPRECRPGQRPAPVKESYSGTPGNCCPRRYNCVPSGKSTRAEKLRARARARRRICYMWPLKRNRVYTITASFGCFIARISFDKILDNQISDYRVLRLIEDKVNSEETKFRSVVRFAERERRA